jgi:hypothetical protein
MAAPVFTGERLTAELVVECRSHFGSGFGVDDVATITELDTETVQRIHDVHTDRIRPQVNPMLRGRSMARKNRRFEGREAERQARLAVALRLVVSGFSIELAAAMSGIEVDAVEAAEA